MLAPSERKTVLVAGLGMVGIAFIEKLLTLDQAWRYKIITCGEEAHLAYNRVALTDYFQHRSVDQLFLNPPEWYTANQGLERFQFHVGERVTFIDTAAQSVRTSQGREIKYDVCVLATGSNAGFPRYCTPERAASIDGIFVYRNIADLEKLLAYANHDGVKGGKALVIGGGLLGLEAAKAVYDLEAIPDVAIINRSAFPLSRQIDNEAGELVLQRIESLGVKVYTKCGVKDILTTTSSAPNAASRNTETFAGLEFEDGTILSAQLVIFAIGISPRDDLARESGIDVHKKGGIVVDDYLTTSAKDVYAIGECASWRGNTYGLIGPGVEMADILAFNLTQTETQLGTFAPRKMNDPDLSTKLKLMGVDVASFGDFFADQRMREKFKAEARPKAKEAVESAPNLMSATEAPRQQPIIETVSNSNSAPKHVGNGNGNGVSQGDVLNAECISAPPHAGQSNGVTAKGGVAETRRQRKLLERPDEPIKCLTYKDPFASVYKKYIFSADGKYLLGGMMIGDVGDYVKLVSIVKKKKRLEIPPSEFIVGSNKGDDDGADLDDDAVVCSCHNVTKGGITKAVAGGCNAIGDLKSKTKAGTGCGGCIPLVTKLFQMEMKRAGIAANNNLCSHFAMSRVDLFNIVKIKRLKDFPSVMAITGTNPESVGCETCKPTVASILSSLYNEHIMKPIHHQNQETNDKYLANIQRNGTFSVVPRVSAGEITPDGLIVIGQVAKKYGLYTKLTGGQRIDMFGAQKADLPSIWAELVEAGFQSGHAYGKSLRTVKSCVGTTWCRYGVGDSVGLAVQLEERYKSVRSPHKIKGGVSGCVRECAEAQSKDFGLIATDKGWNLFVAGNGGASPKHAILFAADVPPSKVVRLIDRFLMFYIRTADKLTRTARWVESFEGGIEKLRKVLIEDELGICEDLEKEMDALIGTYQCEWTEVVQNPDRQKMFRQFVNTNERTPGSEIIKERGQSRPADWPKEFPGVKITEKDVKSYRDAWEWRPLVKVADLGPADTYTTSAAVKYGDSQLAIFHVPRRGYFAVQQMCPHKRAFVLDHGVVGDDSNGNLYVSCPLHKRNFKLDSGQCLNDDNFGILAFEVKEEDGFLLVKLPEPDELDEAIGTRKWMVKAATAEAFGRGGGTQIEIVGPDGRILPERHHPNAASCDNGQEGAAMGCGDKRLDW